LLLAEDEDFGSKSYVWVVTRTEADWIELKTTASRLSEQIKALRSSLTFDIDKPFDAQLGSKFVQRRGRPDLAFADPVFSKEPNTQVAALRSLVDFYQGVSHKSQHTTLDGIRLIGSKASQQSVVKLGGFLWYGQRKSWFGFQQARSHNSSSTRTGLSSQRATPRRRVLQGLKRCLASHAHSFMKEAPQVAQRVARTSAQPSRIGSRGNLADMAEVQKLTALPDTTDGAVRSCPQPRHA
jgi:hypothetical protein